MYGKQNNCLVTKTKETYDGALPAGNSVMAYCLVRLSQITGKKDYTERAENNLDSCLLKRKNILLDTACF